MAQSTDRVAHVEVRATTWFPLLRHTVGNSLRESYASVRQGTYSGIRMLGVKPTSLLARFTLAEYPALLEDFEGAYRNKDSPFYVNRATEVIPWDSIEENRVPLRHLAQELEMAGNRRLRVLVVSCSEQDMAEAERIVTEHNQRHGSVMVTSCYSTMNDLIHGSASRDPQRAPRAPRLPKTNAVYRIEIVNRESGKYLAAHNGYSDDCVRQGQRAVRAIVHTPHMGDAQYRHANEWTIELVRGSMFKIRSHTAPTVNFYLHMDTDAHRNSGSYEAIVRQPTGEGNETEFELMHVQDDIYRIKSQNRFLTAHAQASLGDLRNEASRYAIFHVPGGNDEYVGEFRFHMVRSL